MKKLSEYKNEEALELLAELIVPVTEVLVDKEVVKKFRENKLKGIAYALKHHTKAVFACMAVLNGKPVESYTCNIISLPKTILDVINDKDLMDFFTSQSQEAEEESSGSATTTGKGKK